MAALFALDGASVDGASGTKAAEVPFCTIDDAGSTATGSISCNSNAPEPIITPVPTEGTPGTTTKTRAGPGAMMAAFGGICEACRTAVLFS